MKLTSRHCYLFLLFFTGIGCGTTKYVSHSPDTPVVPFFKEKGDMKIAAGGLWNGSSNKAGLTTQAAYAITKNFAATLSYNTQHDKEKKNLDWTFIVPSLGNEPGRFYKRQNLSIGGGYFKVIGERQNRSLNLYGGIGLGNVKMRESDIFTNDQPRQVIKNPNHSNKVIQYYLHPSYSIMPGNVFRGNFGARVTVAHFHNYTSTLPPDILTYRSWTLQPQTLVYLEPSVNIQIQLLPQVAFDMGLTFNIPVRMYKAGPMSYESGSGKYMDGTRGLLLYTRFSLDFSK